MLFGFCLAIALADPLPATAEDDLTIFAAASLGNALSDISQEWTAETGDQISVSLAGSSVLARQIQNGAPADVFISANVRWMDVLENDGLIDADSRFDLLSNSLVLIAYGSKHEQVNIEHGFDLSGMLGQGKLAMALVDSVPAGIYGRSALENLGVWKSVADKVAQADNVRAALALVATGNAPYGIVYATDAIAEDRVSVVGRFPETSHPPIIYPAAATAGGNSAAAARFLAFLRRENARAAFERQGFEILPR